MPSPPPPTPPSLTAVLTASKIHFNRVAMIDERLSQTFDPVVTLTPLDLFLKKSFDLLVIMMISYKSYKHSIWTYSTKENLGRMGHSKA